MSQLIELGVVASQGKALDIFEQICPDIFENPGLSPSEFVNKVWDEYLATPQKDRTNNINGSIFEYLIASVLLRNKVFPFHRGAEIAFIPNIVYDFVLLTEATRFICLSAKTSLRERYKQADLEAMALKNVHRTSKYYLITNTPEECTALENKIKAGEILALDKVILANSLAFDELIYELSKEKYIENYNQKVIISGRVCSLPID